MELLLGWYLGLFVLCVIIHISKVMDSVWLEIKRFFINVAAQRLKYMLMRLHKLRKLWRWVICDHQDWSSFILPNSWFAFISLQVTHYLGGENYVFWGGREGYQTLLNTDMKRELDHLVWVPFCIFFTLWQKLFAHLLDLSRLTFFKLLLTTRRRSDSRVIQSCFFMITCSNVHSFDIVYSLYYVNFVIELRFCYFRNTVDRA